MENENIESVLSEESSEEATEELLEEVTEESQVEFDESEEGSLDTEESEADESSQILEEIYERLVSIEECLTATPEPQNFLNREVDGLTVTEGLLLVIVMILAFALLKDWIGGVLESCIKR